MPKKTWPVLVGEYTSLAFLLPVATFVGYAVRAICSIRRSALTGSTFPA